MALTSTGVDSAVEELGRLEIHSGFPELLQQELRFLIKFLLYMYSCKQADEDVNLTIAVDAFQAVLKESGYNVDSETDDSDEDEELASKAVRDEEEDSDAKADSDKEKGLDDSETDDSDENEELASKAVRDEEEDSDAKADNDVEKELDSMVYSLQNQFEKFKPDIEKICALLLDSIKSISCSSDAILNVANCLAKNFMDLSNLNAGIVVSVKDQILVLAEKLSFLRILVDFFPKRCIDQQILKDFVDNVKDLMHAASYFSLFGLVKGKDEIVAQGWRIMLSDLLQHRVMPPTPEMIIDLLKTSKSSRSDKFHVGEVVVRLVDFLLQVSPDTFKNDVDILKQDLIIMITFLIEQEEAVITNAGDELFTPVADINEVLSLFSSLSIGKLSVDVSSLQGKIDKVKVGIRKLYVPSLNSSDLSFPRTHRMGFVSFFMEKLNDLVKYHLDEIAFARHQLLVVHKHLESFLKSIMEQQHEELKDLWGRIIDLVFQAEHVVSSCLTIDHPIWHDMLRLADVADAIKIAAVDVRNYNARMNKKRLTGTKIDSSQVLMKRTEPSSLEDVVVGLTDETKSIIDILRRATKKLHIVSIVGMPGLGKTTIAKRVYNDLGYDFDKRAWCCVSQAYNRRELLFDILTNVTDTNARQKDAELTDDDLAEKLRKVLKQQRYLIVLDDMWDINAWVSIKHSLPDDKNGSRIIFTSRIDDLALQTKKDCNVHRLRQFSDKESWELLKLKLSITTKSPPDDEQTEVGKQIAKNCNGLPLTVVLVAGILPGKDITFWKDIRSQVSKGCMDVLTLSYNHLPDNLKPCFLYFGAFPEDRVVRSKKLMSLWIAEGLIPRDDKMSFYEIAEDYLYDLINRNLVILAERSSIGGIKACRIHDLLRDFCLEKSREDKFLQVVDEGDIFHYSCDLKKYENYRLCIHVDWTKFVDAKPSGRYVRSIVLVDDEAWKTFPCPYDFLNSFRLLNVLDLECIKIDGAFPEEVTLMVNLRYLAIRCNIGGDLPSSISNLWTLEVLIIKGRCTIDLPRTFWLMKNLRRVSINLVWVSKSMKDNEFGQLEHLEIFSTVSLISGDETKELFRRLPAIRKFNFQFIERSSSINPYKFPKLSNLTQLESLQLRIYDVQKINDWSSALDFPCSLRKLMLEGCRLPWTAISVVGKLPNLEVLKLRWYAFSGRRWNVEDCEFEALKFLELYGLDIEEWAVEDDPFPSLERLVVFKCHELGEIPSGLGDIPTLKKIEMHSCTSGAARSVEEILEQQKEMGNDVPQVDLVDCIY